MDENLNNENIENVAPAETTPASEPVEPATVSEPGAPEPVAEVPVEETIVPAVSETPAVTPEEKPEEKLEEKPVVKADKKWFVVQTLTGQEDRAKQAIEEMVENEGLKERIFQVLVPIEETVEIKGGKRHDKIRKMFPGYVFVEMVLDEETWYMIRQTTGVARFIGTKVQPTPVSDKEMQRVLKQLGKEERLEISFEKGEGVRVISGPFRGYTGSVDEINAEKGKLKVLINIFGRDTPVEVNFEHAQRIV